MGVASIKVNGVEYCHKKLGHNVVVLDPAGQFVASRNFDTTTQEGGVAMGRFLDELPEDHIVLIATQETTGSQSVSPTKARVTRYLIRIGMTLSSDALQPCLLLEISIFAVFGYFVILS